MTTKCYGPNFGQGIHWKHLQETDRYKRVVSLHLNVVTGCVDFKIDKKKFCEETGLDSTQQYGDENGCLVLVLPYLRVFCQKNYVGNVLIYLNCCSDYNWSDEEIFRQFVMDFENFIETRLIEMGYRRADRNSFEPVFQKNFNNQHECYNSTIKVLAEFDDRELQTVKIRQYGERELASLSLVVGMQQLSIQSMDEDGITFATQNGEPVKNLQGGATVLAIEKPMAIDLETVAFSDLPSLSRSAKFRWSTLVRLDPIKVVAKVARCRWNCLGFNKMEQTERSFKIIPDETDKIIIFED